jgi:ACS family glucarate transporter-like MFS transporter
MLTAFQQMGGAFVPIAAGYVALEFGWRWTLPIFAVPGFIWAAWFYYWFRDRPEDHSSVSARELAEIRKPLGTAAVPAAAPHHDAPVPWRVLLLSPALAMICTQQFFRGAAYIFYSTWFATYLREGRHVDIKTAGWLTSLPLWANAVGCLVGGGLSDWLLVRTGNRRISRQGLAVLTQLSCAAFVLIAYQVSDPTIAVLIISVGSFCAAGAGPIAYAITIDMGGNYVRPVFSLMNMWGNLGSLVFPQALAWLVGEGEHTNWNLALPLFAALYAVAGVCWLGFNPNRPIVPVPSTSNGISDVD